MRGEGAADEEGGEQMSTTISAYERIGRLNKSRALARVILSACPTGTAPERIADILESWQPSDWARAAVCAAVYPPSAETRAAVVSWFRGER
jgi:hypothetical protein